MPTCEIGVQCELDETMTVRLLPLEAQGYNESYYAHPPPFNPLLLNDIQPFQQEMQRQYDLNQQHQLQLQQAPPKHHFQYSS